MATALPQFAEFNPSGEAGGLATRWKKWINRFNNLLVALSVTEVERKRALLLHYVGEQTVDIFDTLPETGAEKDFKKAVDALNKYFSPKQNTEYEVYKFRQASQQVHETIDMFHTRLQQLADTCDFHSKDREVKTQIIQTCTSTRLRRRALREPDMTLTDLLTAARAMEMAEKQASGIEDNASTTVNLVRSSETKHKPKLAQKQTYKTRTSKPNTQCRNCGGSFPHQGGRQACPAYGAECMSCNKLNHFAKYCLSATQNTGQQSSETGGSSQKPKSGGFSRKQRKQRKQPKHVNKVTEQPHDSQSSSDDEYIFTLHDVHTMGYLPDKSKNFPHFAVDIDGATIHVMADTGAGVNLLDEHDFDKIQPKPNLKSPHIKLFPYKSTEPVPILGQFDATITSKSTSVTSPVYVIPRDTPGFGGSLLSWRSAVDLNLVKIIQEINPTPSTVDALVEEYSDIFVGIGKLKDFQVKLHIDDTVPAVAQAHRRIPFHLRQKVEEQLELDEKLGIIEKVDGPTPWVSPVVIVPKPKNPEKVRVCVDMRCANQAIRRERHITPTVDDIINDLNGATVFSKLDLNQGYNQLELAPESRYITTFSTHKGLRRFKRLSFGISSAAEIFQNAVREALSGLPGVINISDDVLIHGKTQEEHDNNLHGTFQRLREQHITLNRDKCVYNKHQLEFYGHVFGANGMSPDPKKVESILRMENPSNATEVRSLLGMINYCARFIPNYATLTEPLRALTHKDVSWEWTDTQETALKSLKQALASTPVMEYFDPAKTTELVVDASPVGLGAILTQKSNDSQNTHVVSYASRALSSVEQRYSQTEREALAIVWACEHFHLFVYGKPVTVITDHKPLESIFNNPRSKPSARLERWSLRLQPYAVTVKYKPGAQNAADYMSRHPLADTIPSSRAERVAEEYVNFVSAHATPKAVTLEEIRSATKADPTLQQVSKSLNTGVWKTTKQSKQLRSFASAQSELSVLPDGIILCGTRIVIPHSLQEKLVQQAHIGHQGMVKTKRLLRTKVWFPGMDSIVENVINNCVACQAANHDNSTLCEPLQMSDLPRAPWTEVSADFCGPLPCGEYLLVVIDDYSRFPEVERITTTSAKATIPVLDKIFATHGIPEILKTDNGTPFNSQEFSDFMAHLGIHHRKITPYWPKANAGAERFMKTLEKAIRTAHVEGKNWKQELYSFLRSYRATPHSTTNKAPAEVLFNHAYRTSLPQLPQECKDSSIRGTDTKAKQRMKQYSDRKSNTRRHRISVGDTVLIRVKKTNKLSTPFSPLKYKVIRMKGTMVTAQRGEHVVTRNRSFFKVISDDNRNDLSDADDEMDLPIANAATNDQPARQNPPRQRFLPNHLKNFELY